MCNFDQGFKVPEMIKTRPVVVLTPRMDGRDQLVTVVVLSCVTPDPICPFHCQLPQASVPMIRDFDTSRTWVKGDMVYAVAFHRLDLIKLGKRDSNNKRI